MDNRYFVTFVASNGLVVKVLMDNVSSNMTGGFGGWEVVERPKRVGMTRFKGKDPFRMDVPILFDGWRGRESQEIHISTLARMAEQPGEQLPPPTLKVSGPLPRTDLTWVIETIDWDKTNVTWEVVGGVSVRVRQAAVVHLLQFVDDNIIVTKASPAVKAGGNKGGGKSKQAAKNTTLRHEAQNEYGDSELWPLLADANGIADPRQTILPGTGLYIPPKPGP